MAKLINMTPHECIIILNGDVVERIAPSGKVARVEERSIPVGEINGIPLVRKEYGKVQVIARADFLAKVVNPAIEELPEEQAGVIYIVPMLVGQAAPSLAVARTDLIGSDFGIGGVRSSDGTATGASGFIQY